MKKIKDRCWIEVAQEQPLVKQKSGFDSRT